MIENSLNKYYNNNKLKSEYTERTDEELLNHFKDGLLAQFKSEDILLRQKETHTILDYIRKEVVWE